MKRISILFYGLFFCTSQLLGQTITVGKVQRTSLCTGDTIWVPYSASGSFAVDNFFAVQISDPTGSFSNFKNAGNNINPSDSIPVIMNGDGKYFHVRVIATDPYIISENTSDDISVSNYPTPKPILDLKETSIGWTGFVGKPIQFHDSKEAEGSKYFWSFDQDPDFLWSTIQEPIITYGSEGNKTGRLTVNNANGCSQTVDFNFTLLSCNPIIPDSAFLVRSSISEIHPVTWVKPGGNYFYNNSAPGGFDRVFVEPGASVQINGRNGIFFIRDGASCTLTTHAVYNLLVLNKNKIVDLGGSVNDTLYCDDLQFDYSQINKKDVQPEPKHLQIFTYGNSLQATSENSEISAALFSPLGIRLFSKVERNTLDLDLSTLAEGMYFVEIMSGSFHEVRKIIVMH